MLVIKEYNYTYLEIKTIFEFLKTQFAINGITTESSTMILKNLQILESTYNEIINGIYNPETDLSFISYNQELQNLIIKYADRDEQGNIVYVINNNKQIPKLTEMIVEYNNELQLLQDKYKQTLNIVNNYQKYNTDYLNTIIKIKVYTWQNLYDFPDKLPPFFQFYFARDLI